MRILFLIDSLQKGGKERQLVELIKGLSNSDDNVIEVVVMKENIEYQEVVDFNVKINYLIRKTKRDFSVFKSLYSICKNFKPDVIHTWDSMTTFYVLPYKILNRVKVINGSIRFAASNLKSNWKLYYFNKFLFAFSDVIVANSKSGLETFALKPSKKNRFIYNGFDLTRIDNLTDPAKMKKKLNITSEKVICMVSSFEDHKDNKTFVEAAILTLKERNDVVFLAIGDGKNFDECKRIVNDYPNIRLLGQKDDAESFINISDIGVQCSNIGKWGEGISNAILEFYSLSKPMLATDSGGTKEVVLDNVSGFLLKPNDPEYLHQKIIFLLNNPETGVLFGKKGNELVNQTFGLMKMVNNYSSLYEEINQKSFN